MRDHLLDEVWGYYYILISRTIDNHRKITREN